MSVKEKGAELNDALKEWSRRLKVQRKAVIDVLEGEAKSEVGKLCDGLSTLDPDLWRHLGLGERAEQLALAARERLVNLRSEQRRAFARSLQEAAAAAGRDFRRLGENPPEFRLAPFSVFLDLERMEASLCYAREELCRVPARAETILAAAAREQKTLEKRQLSPEAVFDLLLTAYRAVLGARGLRPGARIDLVEVLPHAALLRQPKGFRADPVRERFASYPKAAFLFDLARMQAARLLEREGLRLDLGTATGDSVRQKTNVFYLERPNGDGQYYLSLRFVPRTGRLPGI